MKVVVMVKPLSDAVLRATTLAIALLLCLVSAPVPKAQADQWRDSQEWITEYGFDQAWKETRGEGITVAVIDTGIDDTHPDLTGQVVGGTDVSGQGHDDGTKPIGEDPHHGTSVASLLAGHGNNLREVDQATQQEPENDDNDEEDANASEDAETDTEPESEPSAEPGPGDDGIIGTAPEAQLLSISVYLGDGEDVPSAEEQIAEAVTWAVDQGADVINISLASSEQDWPESWDDAFLYAEENAVVVVVAAGNRAGGSTTVGAPATIPGVLTVAGLDADGSASWDFSTEGITIGVAAPADPLVGATPDGGYQNWSGTSGAAPLVSGLVALVRSAHPEDSAAQVINRILSTAQPAGDSGTDALYGHGVINAEQAVTAQVPTVKENPMGSMAEWIRVHRRSSDDDALTGRSDQYQGHEPVEVPTELPGDATAQSTPATPMTGAASWWQPVMVIGGTGLVVALAGTGIWQLATRRAAGRPTSR
ncbi:S8 family serine peptidase [Auritidibacter ignavus]|uniref:S8 family serine peptidase n=1 Tax=Auritidibacter ignavus TaxID=678932 RepID=UPI00244D1038|nr:S8 family serine peptidase [Auritidibacter ignavus]WGH91889.1 S8 family serine peptidase [Auritidibacter ignavus]